ncbi:SDR family NAD(P)-dependent oxidoreductase [Streptantibioticus cattleyicolor]|uniref:Short-chain dehydrogenase/reductase SDR n=1 Tax=Streptantibioticus cattleyicolor (strain ATCC 35852 / DSM 46488 / JCM 4925 / NBRC 14057 / NRRL 8057) TaxID=1003195 RepID=F8JKL7_STREN|nr:SDR family NAD(P)-dependent oxidoreductase [Streptantibioticus cattleyicolor]AEW99708.1 short-chain dehydrogenase/reductase SDR [Streptantibioticus cattleyicolor NRRL 8057 = DSM 46488]CCB71253.1 protein of unknown function [Streptantibioticus cattleyicolor NRRL 8057 = DSM 46488]
MSEHRETSRFAVVTGGSEGLGLAIADALAHDGADLILVARDHDKLKTAAEELGRHGTTVHTVSADLSAPDASARIATQVGNLTAQVDTLVNNVGTAHFAPPRRHHGRRDAHHVAPQRPGTAAAEPGTAARPPQRPRKHHQHQQLLGPQNGPRPPTPPPAGRSIP